MNLREDPREKAQKIVDLREIQKKKKREMEERLAADQTKAQLIERLRTARDLASKNQNVKKIDNQYRTLLEDLKKKLN